MKIKTWVALQLDETNLKILHIKGTGPDSVILAAGTFVFSQTEPALCAEELRRFLRELKIDSPWALACLSRTHTTTRLLSLPSTDPAEIRKMVGFQAIKQVPFSKEEIVLDYVILGKTGEGYSRLLLTIVPKKEVEKILSLVGATGLNLLGIRLNTQEAAFFYETRWLNRKKIRGPVLFVDLDIASADFVVVENGWVPFSRSVNLGKAALSSGDQGALERLKTEVENTLALYKKEAPEAPLKSGILVGPPAAVTSLFQTASREWGVTWEAWTNPQDELETFHGKKAFRIPSHTVSFSALFGAALNLENPVLNFLPEAIETKRREKLLRQDLARFSIFFVLLFVMGGLFLFLKNHRQENILAALRSQTEQTESLAQSLEKKKQKIQLVEAQRARKNFSLDLLEEVTKLVPNEISLDSLAYDSKIGLTLKGTAFSLSDVFKLIPQLEASPYFEKVVSKGTGTKKIKDKTYTDFYLECPLASLPEGPP